MAIDEHLARRLVTAARRHREWRQRRDALIVEALEAGGSEREVARHAGLTGPGVRAIRARVRGDADHRDDPAGS